MTSYLGRNTGPAACLCGASTLLREFASNIAFANSTAQAEVSRLEDRMFCRKTATGRSRDSVCGCSTLVVLAYRMILRFTMYPTQICLLKPGG